MKSWIRKSLCVVLLAVFVVSGWKLYRIFGEYTGDFFGLRIKGNSMEPRIREGDVVIVRKQEDADTGDTAVVLVNGDSATAKRIKKEPDRSLWLIPNNPAYDPQHFSPAEVTETPVHIIGRLVELRGKF